jgi:hypothetical protein
MGNKTLNVCSVLVVSLQTTMEKTTYDVQKVSDGRTHLELVWRKILFVSLVRNKHCFVVSLYPLYLYFFLLCNYSLYFPCTLFTFPNLAHSSPHIRNTHFPILGIRMRLIWGDKAFTEINFTRVFLFIMYDVYVTTVFINQIKLFLCFEKFYIFLSLMAV